MLRLRIFVSGTVQGVGFRPYIYRLAVRYQLTGWVRNHAAGVEIQAQGDAAAVYEFTSAITTDKPPLAVISEITAEILPLKSDSTFLILASTHSGEPIPMIAPDIAACPDCLHDIAASTNRRYRYPFTNCTNCGPRYTIIKDIPYDRAATTMAEFVMCEHCRQEYADPLNRRFHAQPNACPVCGPAYRLLDHCGQAVPTPSDGDILTAVRQLITAGNIVAIKGLGGYHLACDARSSAAVELLRSRKVREDKPFAVMCGHLATAMRLGQLSAAECGLLIGAARPIVLAGKGAGYDLATAVAPGNPRIGIMLPYTPAHELLLPQQDVWVMTSGNTGSEPIAYQDDDALQRLSGLADYFLVHNRPIHRRADDSVAHVVHNAAIILRRSRGYTPAPLQLAQSLPSILACGGELKTTFCLTHDNRAYLSAHIGDLENLPTYNYYVESIEHYQRLLNIQPQLAACDLHPEYLSTKYAETLAVPLIKVQHHHAHIAAVLAEHHLDEPVIGVAFDGTGYGPDGTLWGSEFLIADYQGFTRAAHCRYLPLPGGSKAITEPWRMAVWVLHQLFGENLTALQIPFVQSLPREWPLIIQLAAKNLNSPLTSSAGRLFDIAAALCGIRSSIHYEGQAAVELELAAGKANGEILPYAIQQGQVKVLDFMPTFHSLVELLSTGRATAYAAASFHATVADAIYQTGTQISRATGITNIALSGGVFQNIRLLAAVIRQFEQAGFTVYFNRQVPPNDGGISLGQAVIAAATARL